MHCSLFPIQIFCGIFDASVPLFCSHLSGKFLLDEPNHVIISENWANSELRTTNAGTEKRLLSKKTNKKGYIYEAESLEAQNKRWSRRKNYFERKLLGAIEGPHLLESGPHTREKTIMLKLWLRKIYKCHSTPSMEF